MELVHGDPCDAGEGADSLGGMQELIAAATPLLGELRLSRPEMTACTVAAALRTAGGRIHTGVCFDVSCGIGFCAEHSAVAEMLKAKETEIEAIVAVSASGVLPPCGRCRELMVQVNERNFGTRVGLPGGREALLRDLLPEHWMS